MGNLIEDILNNYEQEQADKKALLLQKEQEKQMFLDAWDHVSREVIGKSMQKFGEQLRQYHHQISYQRKTPPGHPLTEDSYGLELANSRLTFRLYFAIDKSERKVIVIKHYAYRSRKGVIEAPLPPGITNPLSQTRHEITDITPEFIETLVAEGLKTLLYVTAQP